MTVEKFLEIVQIKYVIIYLVAINLIGFFAMLIDKQKAKRGAYRIPEKILFILTLLGRMDRYNRWNVPI